MFYYLRISFLEIVVKLDTYFCFFMLNLLSKMHVNVFVYLNKIWILISNWVGLEEPTTHKQDRLLRWRPTFH